MIKFKNENSKRRRKLRSIIAKIKQSRGKFNKSTKYHDTILQMMSRLHIYKNKTFKIKAS